jgi:hypothetical protein
MMVWGWITAAVTLLLVKLKDALAGMIGKVLGTFGLTLVSFNSILPNLKAFVLSQMSGLSGPSLDLLGYLQVGTAISMVLSALTVRLTWKVFLVPTSVANQLSGGAQ